MANVQTGFALPPGPVPTETARLLFELIFERFRWVTPVRFGALGTDERLRPDEKAATVLLDFLNREGSLAAEEKGRSVYLGPDQPGEKTYTGELTWYTPERLALSPWREEHATQLVTVAKVLEAPIAWATLESEYRRKWEREVPYGPSIEVLPRIRGYNEGLLGVFWRNVYGPPFVEAFGEERLSQLPSGSARPCGDGYWFVEAYPTPQDALTDFGRERERTIISILGPEHFYDFENERPPARRPPLPDPTSTDNQGAT